MVQVKEFTIGCAKVVNLGNYNNIRIEAQLTVVVSEPTNFAELRKEAQLELRQMLVETWNEQRKEK